MTFISEIFSLFCVLIFISNLNFGSPMGKMMSGGGGILYITNNKPSALQKQNDLLVIQQKGCSPTIIKNSYKGKDMLMVGECNIKKKIKKEYIPVPMPVKEYVPMPVIKKEKQIIIMPMKKEMPMMMMPMKKEMPMMMMPMKMPMKMDYEQMNMYGGGGEAMYGGGGEAMYGMDTKKSVSHMSPDNTGVEKEEPKISTQMRQIKPKRVKVTKTHKTKQ